jgi:hypothetical protein
MWLYILRYPTPLSVHAEVAVNPKLQAVFVTELRSVTRSAQSLNKELIFLLVYHLLRLNMQR